MFFCKYYSKLQKFNGSWLDLDTSGDLDDFEDRGQFITLGTLLDFYNNYVSPVNPASEDEEDKGILFEKGTRVSENPV